MVVFPENEASEVDVKMDAKEDAVVEFDYEEELVDETVTEKTRSDEDLAFAAIAGEFGVSNDDIRSALEEKGLDADKILDIRSKILHGEYFA